MSTEDIVVSTSCPNCGKDGANNICNKCKQVKYCNAVCKKVHKKKHKKDCEEYQRRAAKLHDDKLFKQPLPAEDCPICFLRLPSLPSGSKYMACCGKTICSGCTYAPVYDNQGNEVDNQKCAFCRTPSPKTEEEFVEREKKRMEKGDAIATHNLGYYYEQGEYGYPQDYTKALELCHRAAELGYAAAYCGIGGFYEFGRGVEVDMKKARYYCELGAIAGDVLARHMLGMEEEKARNMDRALKHHMIAVRDGDNDSLDSIKLMYEDGDATKDDFTKALRLYQEYLGEIKSRQRDEAAAADEENRYY